MAAVVLGSAAWGCAPRRSPRIPPGETFSSTVRVHRLQRYPAHENRDLRGDCMTEKINFIRQNSCWNGGSIEFCIRRDDASAVSSIQHVAPDVSCAPSTEGRAACDPAREERCVLTLDESSCVHPGGAMTEVTWKKVCSLSRLDVVRRIVPSWDGVDRERAETEGAPPEAERRRPRR